MNVTIQTKSGSEVAGEIVDVPDDIKELLGADAVGIDIVSEVVDDGRRTATHDPYRQTVYLKHETVYLKHDDILAVTVYTLVKEKEEGSE